MKSIVPTNMHGRYDAYECAYIYTHIYIYISIYICTVGQIKHNMADKAQHVAKVVGANGVW